MPMKPITLRRWELVVSVVTVLIFAAVISWRVGVVSARERHDACVIAQKQYDADAGRFRAIGDYLVTITVKSGHDPSGARSFAAFLNSTNGKRPSC